MEIKRDKYLNDLINRMHNGLIKVVTGIRRCGKSYLIESRIADREWYYVLLDEVQMLNEFDEVLNSLLHIKNRWMWALWKKEA